MDHEAIITYASLLIVSVPRVVLTIVDREAFGEEASLAALLVVLCLGLLGAAFLRAPSRRKRSAAPGPVPSLAGSGEEQES